MSVLGTIGGIVTAHFSRGPGIAGSGPTSAPSRIPRPLTITVLRRVRRLDTLTGVQRLSRSVCAGKETAGAGILTCFPVRRLRLRAALGSTNPWLTNIAKEPLPLRRRGFPPRFAATLSRILVGTRSTGPHGPASAHAPRPLTKSPRGVLQCRYSV